VSTKDQARQERAAKLAAVQAAQRGKERRRAILVISGVAVVAAILIGVTVSVVLGEQNRQNALEEAAAAPIEGVVETTGLEATHVTGTVDYEQTPPVGGNHSGTWANCGIYTAPTVDEEAVHSLEHGAVWITYDPALPADQLKVLTDLAQGEPYVLLSPYEGVPSPVVATAWGLQLELDDAGDPRLEQFVVKYQQGEQTLEPGAPCSGGSGTPA